MELGWRRAVPDVQDPYVTAILSSVFSASVTSTPSPLPPDVFSSLTTVPLFGGGTKRDIQAPTASTATTTTTSIPSPTKGCTVVAPSGIEDKLSGTHTYHHSVCSQVTSSIGLGPSALAPYQVVYNSSAIAMHKSALNTYKSKFIAATESIVSSATATATTNGMKTTG